MIVDKSGPDHIYYGNNGDVKPACNAFFQGVNIIVPNVSSDVASAIDKSIDDGNITCGTVRYSVGTGRLAYMLSSSSSL